ncbi:MAG: methyltransferase type 11, partial [Mycobacteriaceae bacterium]|nr:methyltransferase type 11 [Mycobacteriaceae bacterium]
MRAAPHAPALELLSCPVCADDTALAPGSAGQALVCARNHSFDIARQGYVSLLAGAANARGDTAAMLADRDAFQQAGHFLPIAAAVAAAATATAHSDSARVADVGAGTGYYLAQVLDALPDSTGVAVDVAKAAARRAAGAHPRALAVVADAWRGLPL